MVALYRYDGRLPAQDSATPVLFSWSRSLTEKWFRIAALISASLLGGLSSCARDQRLVAISVQL